MFKDIIIHNFMKYLPSIFLLKIFIDIPILETFMILFTWGMFYDLRENKFTKEEKIDFPFIP